MDKKQITLFSFLVVITLALAGAALYMQQTHSVHVNAAVQKANSQRASAISELTQHDAQSEVLQTAANVKISAQASDISQLCGQLTKAKLTNTICTTK